MTREKSWGKDVFDRLYRDNPDPWNFSTSPYEQEKLLHLLSFLPKAHVGFIIELGCSIGISTHRLAERCDALLAIDGAPRALDHARRNCAGRSNVAFLEAFLPHGLPDLVEKLCDLVVISEILYFLSEDDVETLALGLQKLLAEDAAVVLVNWTGVTDTPCTGDDAAARFIGVCAGLGWVVDGHERQENYRLDRLSRATPGETKHIIRL